MADTIRREPVYMRGRIRATLPLRSGAVARLKALSLARSNGMVGYLAPRAEQANRWSLCVRTSTSSFGCITSLFLATSAHTPGLDAIAHEDRL